MPAFDKRVSDFEAANTQVLGISTDSPFSHENWAKSVGISNYPLLSDVQRTVAKDYGVYWTGWNATGRARAVPPDVGDRADHSLVEDDEPPDDRGEARRGIERRGEERGRIDEE